MAITAAQRSTALREILASAIAASGTQPLLPLGTLLPGVTAAQVLSTVLTALGSGVDATLTTALANMVIAANAKITADKADETVQGANVTAWTVV